MSYTAEEVAEHVGRKDVSGEFVVRRGTDTETVTATPYSVAFGRHRRGPLVRLNFNKHHAFLPPWRELVEFTLDGKSEATFAMPEYCGDDITGKLKTVNIVSPTVKLHS